MKIINAILDIPLFTPNLQSPACIYHTFRTCQFGPATLKQPPVASGYHIEKCSPQLRHPDSSQGLLLPPGKCDFG